MDAAVNAHLSLVPGVSVGRVELNNNLIIYTITLLGTGIGGIQLERVDTNITEFREVKLDHEESRLWVMGIVYRGINRDRLENMEEL